MGQAFGLLLASAFPAALLFYFVGAAFLKRLRLTNVTIIVGFIAAWFASAVIALIIADQPTIESATQSVIPAALVGSLIALVGIVLAGRRKPAQTSEVSQ